MKESRLDNLLLHTADNLDGNLDDLDSVVVELKKVGANQIETMSILVSKLTIPVKDANAIITNSEAWQHMKTQNEGLRTTFLNLIEEPLLSSKKRHANKK